MSEIQFKVTVPHVETEAWHQWWFPVNGFRGDGPTEQRDQAGRARGRREGWFPEWFVLACNNPRCDARAVVPVRMLTDFADEQDPASTRSSLLASASGRA